MPSTYAHYRFGKEVWKRLPDHIRLELSSFQNLYKIGLHGPDIFFYYHPLIPNKVSQTGYQLHEKRARSFFLPALQIIRHSQDPSLRHSMEAYIYGFICHYALDSECHPYVEARVLGAGISHSETEVEFDRMLMTEDHLDPVRHRLTRHIQDSPEVSAIIQNFFPQFSVRKICSSLKGMKFYDKLLLAPNHFKRGLILGAMKLIGQYDTLHGMMVNLEPNPSCIESNQELLRRYNHAIDIAVQLIQNFRECEFDSSMQLSSRFNHTFESELFPMDSNTSHEKEKENFIS